VSCDTNGNVGEVCSCASMLSFSRMLRDGAKIALIIANREFRDFSLTMEITVIYCNACTCALCKAECKIGVSVYMI